MVNYQIIGLGGNLTQDVKVFGEKVAKFGLAVNSGYGEKKKTAFLNCVAFSQGYNEKVWQLLVSLKKGTNVGIKGDLVTNTFGEGDEKKSTLELVVRDFQIFFSGPKEATPVEPAVASAKKETAPNKSQEEEDDQIPF